MCANVINLDNMFINTQISLYNSLVASVLSYGYEIWGFAEAKKIETCHLSFLKHILKVKKVHPIALYTKNAEDILCTLIEFSEL